MRWLRALGLGLGLALLGGGEASAQVVLDAPKEGLGPGATFTLRISVEVGTVPLGGYLYRLDFDPLVLRLGTVTPSGPITELFFSSGLASGTPFLGLNPESLIGPLGRVALATALFEITSDTMTLGAGVAFTTVTVLPIETVGTAGQGLAIPQAQAAVTMLSALDRLPPETFLTLTGPAFAPSTSTLFTATSTLYAFAAIDRAERGDPSGLDFTEFRVDSDTAAFQRFVSSFTLAEAIHRIDFRSQDKAGNVEVIKSSSVLVDGTAPESSLATGDPKALLPDGSSLVGAGTPLLIVSTDPVSNAVASGVKDSFVAVDTTTFQLATGAFTLLGPDGPKKIRFFCVDNVGNAEAARSAAVSLDATPPLARLLSPSAEGLGMDQVFGKGMVPVVASVSDAHLKDFTLEFAQGPEAATGFTTLAAGTAPVSASAIASWDTTQLSGFFTLKLIATDLVGNVSVSTATVFIGEPSLLLALENAKEGSKLLDEPEGVAVDSRGNIYVANRGTDEVLKFSATGQFLLAFDGRTTLIPAKPQKEGKDRDDDDKPETIRFNEPTGLALDTQGKLYVADRNNNRIAVLSSTGTVVRSVGRSNAVGRFIPGQGPGEFNHPTGVAVSSSRIAVADRNNGRVQVFDTAFNFLLQIALPPPTGGSREDDDDQEDGDDGTGEEPKPFGVALDTENNVYVTDEENSRILAFDPKGGLLFALGREGVALGEFSNPKEIAASPLSFLYIADRANKRVQKIGPFQNPVLAFGSTFGLHHPVGLARDGWVNLYLTDRKENRVLKFGLPDGALVVSLPPRPKEKRGRVGSKGGKVEREDRSGVSIPEGALKQELEITIEPERPRPPYELARKADKLKEKKLAAASEAVEYGPEGARFEKPVTITLAYDPEKLPEGAREDNLKVYYWNARTRDWEQQYSIVSKASHTVNALVGHFSLYQVMAPAAKAATDAGGDGLLSLALPPDPTFRLGEVFTYPNPARGGERPVFHVEVGIADKVTIRVYDVSGRQVHKATLDQAPVIKDMGRGPRYAYEHAWDGTIASGVYFYVMEAEKAGEPAIRKVGKLSVVR